MAQNFKKEGKRLTYTNATGSTITSGSPVFVGGRAYIALGDILDTESGELDPCGVWVLPKKASLAITQGDLLYWDATPGEVTKTAADGVPIGMADADAAGAASTVDVHLNAAGQSFPPAATVAALGSTTNLPASNATLSTAGGNTYSDASSKAAIDGAVDALGTAVETRLDNAEAKIDAVIAALKASGAMDS